MTKPDQSGHGAASDAPVGVPNGPWMRLTRTVAYQNQWLTLYHDTVIRPDGREGIYGVVHQHSRTVGVVAIDAEDRVLLVGQHRYALDTYSWEIPAGGTTEGEDPLSTAKRELREETGYTAGTLELILRAHMSNSVSDEEAFCYFASSLIPGRSCPEGTEDIQLRWVPFLESLEMINLGIITDALTILGILRVALLRIRDERPGRPRDE